MTDTEWPPEGTRVAVLEDGPWFGMTGVVVYTPGRGWGVCLDACPTILGTLKRHEIEVIEQEDSQ